MSKQGITDLNLDREYLLRGFTEMPGGFLIYRADWSNEEILYANRVLLEIFECDSEEEFLELSDGSFKGLVHPDDYSIVRMSLRMQVSEAVGDFDHVNHRIITKNGNVVNVESHSKYVISPEEGPLFYAFISESQTEIDELTRLPKRRYFFELAPKSAASFREIGQNAVILAFDFNNMKGYNSRFGMEEGDLLLTRLADLLVGMFGIKNCSRFGEDHFYVCTGEADLETKLKILISEINGQSKGGTMSMRIGIALYAPDISVGDACDRAKFASDTIDNVESEYVWFSEKIYEDIAKREYVLNNVERALSEGWIEPYYQPVIRALTGRLCSVEALARWQDPERGIISPGDFIPVMEEKGLIYKLDMYIVERVVSVLQKRLNDGLPVVPVSVNVSCSDFDFCDPVEIIANICDAHGVRRSLICAEITETALMTDRSMVRDAVERFHKAGIDVWMDDFGSGYSSLSILRDLDFDEIKIDMGFLFNFNERAKTIITSAVRMAKQLGTHTLAEGVETQEHVDFLKSIGCERIQGYYYGKPQPLSELMVTLKEKGIVFEARDVAALYNKVGLVDLKAYGPLALIFYDTRSIEIVFANEQFRQEIESTGLTVEQAASVVMKVDSLTLGSRFRKLAENAVASGNREIMTFIYRDMYYRFSLQLIGSIRSGSMLTASLENIAVGEQSAADERNNIMRNMSVVYDNIYLVDLKEDTRRVIATSKVGEFEGQVIKGLSELYSRENMAELLFEDELDRWEQFANRDHIYKKAMELGRGYFSDAFLMKQENGDYVWTELLLMLQPEDHSKVIVCSKPAMIEDSSDTGIIIDRVIRYGSLHIGTDPSENEHIWDSFMNETDLKIFWKDTDRRFLGASRAFRKYYGFKSDEDFVGKTDEELGWHLNDASFASDDLRILKKGESVISAPNQNVINGIAHNIVASRYPVYKNNKIAGLVGYFIDVDEDIEGNEKLKEGRFQDIQTGLMNVHGMISTLLELENNYKTNGQEYIISLISVEGFQDVLADYGEETAQDLILKLTEELRRVFRFGAVIGKLSGCNFAVCDRNIAYDEMFGYIRRFADDVSNMTEVNGNGCRLSVNYGIATGGEADSIYRVWELADRRREAGNGDIDLSDLTDLSVSPDPYLDLPLSTVVVRPKLDENGVLQDMVFVFVNKVYCELTGRSRGELIGRGYLELFPRTDKNWIYLTYRASLGERIHRKLYDGATHHWLRFTAMPSQIPGACILICEIIDEERRVSKQLDDNKQTADAIIEVAKILDRDVDFNTAMTDVLRYVGEVTGCERSFILRSFDNHVSVPFEWRKDGLINPDDEPYSLDFDHIAYWEELLKEDSSVVFESIELLRDDKPAYYNFFKAHEVEWFINSPFYYNGRMVGYFGVENYRRDKAIDVRKFVESVSFFIVARMRLHEIKSENSGASGEKETGSGKLIPGEKSIEIARMIGGLDDVQKASRKILRALGTMLNASCVFMLNLDGDSVRDVMQWSSDGSIRSEKIAPKQNSKEFKLAFIEELRSGMTVEVRDPELYHGRSLENYLLIKKLGVDTIMEVPVFEEGRLAGFIAVTGYDPENSDVVRQVTETAAYFAGFKMVSLKLGQEVHRLRTMVSTRSEGPEGPDRKTVPAGQEQDGLYMQMPMPSAYIKVFLSESQHNTIDDFEYVNVNDEYCRLVKKDRSEIIGNTFLDLFHNADPQWMSDLYRAAVDRRTIQDYRYNTLAAQWVYFIAAPAGDPGYCMVTMLDYDRPHQLINELDERKSMNRHVIQASKALTREPVFEVAVNRMFGELRLFLKAEYFYLVKVDEAGGVESVCDGAVPGVRMIVVFEPGQEQRVVDRFRKADENSTGYLFEKLEQVEGEDPELAEFLRERNVRNMLTVPIREGSELLGYIGAKNIDATKADLYAEMLRDVSYFAASRISITRKFNEALDDKFA